MRVRLRPNFVRGCGHLALMKRSPNELRRDRSTRPLGQGQNLPEARSYAMPESNAALAITKAALRKGHFTEPSQFRRIRARVSLHAGDRRS